MLSLFSLALVTSAGANSTISDCDDYCKTTCPGSGEPGYDPDDCREADGEGKCELYTDDPNDIIYCSSSGPILYDGTDLDMAGYSIECDPNGCGSYTQGIGTDTDNSKIFNSEGDNGYVSRIDGFYYGVYCQSSDSGEEVNGIRIENTSAATVYCDKVEHCFIDGNSVTYVAGIHAVETAQYNFVGGHWAAISSGGANGTIKLNTIDTDDGHGIAITHNGQTVHDNFFLNDGKDASSLVLSVSGTGHDFLGNICNPNHPDCDDCQDDGYCVFFDAPFNPRD
jgi:hypothetical protein